MRPFPFAVLRVLAGAILSLGTSLFVRAQTSQAGEPPAVNFSLPAFTKEGYRSFLLRASTARFTGPKAIELRDTTLSVFSGDASNHVETVILSPVATFLTDRNVALGAGPVRLIRDDAEITGEQWRYDHARKTISIAKNVRVVFHAALPDLIQ